MGLLKDKSKGKTPYEWYSQGLGELPRCRAGTTDYKKPIECFSKSVQLDPDNAVVWNAMAEAYMELHPRKERERKEARMRAIECFDRALRIKGEGIERDKDLWGDEPSESIVKWQKAEAYQDIARFTVEEALHGYWALNPDETANRVCATCCYELVSKDMAKDLARISDNYIENCKKAIECYIGHPWTDAYNRQQGILLDIGNLLSNARRYMEAMEYYEQAASVGFNAEVKHQARRNIAWLKEQLKWGKLQA